MHDSTEPDAAQAAKRARHWTGRYNGRHRRPDDPSIDEQLEALLEDPAGEDRDPDEQIRR